MQPLTEEEKTELQKLKATERERLLPEQEAAREAWSGIRIEQLTAGGMPAAEARAEVDRWIDRQELSGAFRLPFDDSNIAGTTVENVIGAPNNYVGRADSFDDHGAREDEPGGA